MSANYDNGQIFRFYIYLYIWKLNIAEKLFNVHIIYLFDYMFQDKYSLLVNIHYRV